MYACAHRVSCLGKPFVTSKDSLLGLSGFCWVRLHEPLLEVFGGMAHKRSSLKNRNEGVRDKIFEVCLHIVLHAMCQVVGIWGI